jgi:DUF4097 and DUF4098 domain-containing protein YvlB
MVPRATLIAVLVGVEIAIVAGMATAVSGGSPVRWFGGSVPAVALPGTGWLFGAGANPAVTIDIGHADLTVETRPGAQIAVSIVPGLEIHSSGPITARDEDGTVHVTAADPDSDDSVYADERNVHVVVPPTTRIVVESAGDITASGLRAAATFSSDHGDMTISDVQGEVSATSSDGHIEISDADCPVLHVTSSDGRIVLHHVNATRLEASTSNGRVEATELVVRDGSVSSSNGRVSLGFAAGADTTVRAVASNGDVSVSGLSEGPGAAATSSGDDDNDDSTSKLVRVGAGSGRLSVHASNGNIELRSES